MTMVRWTLDAVSKVQQQARQSEWQGIRELVVSQARQGQGESVSSVVN